jgi:alanine dehydrogenase
LCCQYARVVALSSTQALTSTTLNYGLKIAELGLEEACKHSNDIKLGLNTYDGHIVYPNVAKAFEMPYVEFEKLIGK